MRQKLIVKTNWLSFLPVSQRQVTALQALILSGKIQSEKSIPNDVFTKLSPEESSFLIEKTLQVLGRPALLLQSLENLSSQMPKTSKERTLWHERAFLKGFALSRLGKTTESETWFQLLPEEFHAKIDTERALRKLNLGEIVEAETLFKKALAESEDTFDPYSQCTLLGGLSLALIQKGSFREAEHALRKRRHILKTNISPTLDFGTRLYEILLLLERNEFSDASEQLSGALEDLSEESINGFFLRHLKLRLHLARNELSEAQQILENFKGLVRSQKIPQGVLDFRLEEIEWNLRSRRPDQAFTGIANVETEQTRQDHYLLFRLSLLKAQAHFLKEDYSSAYAQVAAIMPEAEKRRYLPALSWALFHGAGISLAAGHPVQAKLYIHRGERLSSELGLRARFACFSYIAEIMDQEQSSGHALLSLVRRQEIGPELEYYLGTYSLLTSVTLAVSSRRGQETLAEADLRRQLFSEEGLFWFQKEKILLANHSGYRMKLADFSQRPQLLSTFRLFWNAFQNQERGVTLPEIHQTRHASTYREELHAGAAKMQISRLREMLQGCGLKISYDRDQGIYSLQSSLSPFTLLSREEQTEKTHTKRSREEEILSRIAMEPFVPTRILCHEFKVSRQALHPFLSKLVTTKQIRMVKRGPISGYIFISKK